MNNIIVVGGSSGIGLGVINKLKSNNNVINLSRRECKNADINIHCDVTNYNDVKIAFEQIDFNLYKNNILVYSAGFVQPESLLNIKEDTWDKTINTNLNGAFFCTKEFVKKSNGNNDKIIYIASTAGTRKSPNWSAYSASKAGLINFGITMSEELKEYDIKTYVLSCGRCATPLRAKLAPNEDPNTIMQPIHVANFVENIVLDGNLIDGQNIIVRK